VIFIDTGAFLARYIERNQYHDAATEHSWNKKSAFRFAAPTRTYPIYATNSFSIREIFGVGTIVVILHDTISQSFRP